MGTHIPLLSSLPHHIPSNSIQPSFSYDFPTVFMFTSGSRVCLLSDQSLGRHQEQDALLTLQLEVVVNDLQLALAFMGKP